MKYYLEVEADDVSGEKVISTVKQVSSLSVAVSDKDKVKKSYFHKCYHDEASPRPCKRIEITKLKSVVGVKL